MDATLEHRLELYSAMPDADQSVIAWVTDAIERLECQGYPSTDATLGMLVSHLVAALSRARRGEPITDFSAEAVLDEVVDQHPDSYQDAQELAVSANEVLAVEITETETRLIALHLAAASLLPPTSDDTDACQAPAKQSQPHGAGEGMK